MSIGKLQQITNYNSLVGATLAAMRRAVGLDQLKIAEAVGISQSAWSRIENGGTQITVAQLAAAARMLGNTPSGILKRAECLATYLTRRGVRVVDRAPEAPRGSDIALGTSALTELASQLFKG